jgi:hypothetical protein
MVIEMKTRSWLVLLTTTFLLASLLIRDGSLAWVEASSIYAGNTTGYDISFPQCGKAYPSLPYAFGIVGITAGHAFTKNTCFKSEYDWAGKATLSQPSFYMNLNYPVGKTADKGLSGPKGNCNRQDKACQAYNYGWNAAQEAFSYAYSQGATTSTMWWLDIETANSWSPTTSLNDQVIQGAVDFLKSKGATVGVYSTKSMWNAIAGSSFLPNLPNWVSGALNSTSAPSYCTAAYAFGGGTVQLVQYLNGGYDGVYACP